MFFFVLILIVIIGGILMFGKNKPKPEQEITGVMVVVGTDKAKFSLPFEAKELSVAFVDIDPPPSGCNPSQGDFVEIDADSHHVQIKWQVGEPRKIRWTASQE